MFADRIQLQDKYAIAGAAILLLAVAGEVTRIALGLGYPGLTPTASHVLSAILCVLWSACAILLIRRPKSGLRSIGALLLSLLGPISLLFFGAVLRIGGSLVGWLYLAAAILLALIEKRAWGGGEIERWQNEDQNPQPW